MDVKKIQSKLQKLLALSTSPVEAEAKAAMDKARELMRKYNIREVDIPRDDDGGTDFIKTETVDGYTARHAAWESQLAAAICHCFDVECVIQRRPGKWNLMFIGTDSECTIVTDLYKRLRRTISKMSVAYARSTDGNYARLHKSYAFGMIKTVRDRLVKIYMELPTSTDLVLVKKEAIANKMQELFGGNLRKRKSAQPRDAQAYAQGVEDGKHVSLSRSVNGAAPSALT